MTMADVRDDAPVSGPDEDDDVAEDYPVPEPIEVPEDVPEGELSIKTQPGWCGAVDTVLVSGDDVLLGNDDDISTFLKSVKHPGFDAFVGRVRSGFYDDYIKA